MKLSEAPEGKMKPDRSKDSRIALILYGIAITLAVFIVWLTGLLGRDQLLVKGQVCTCPDYEIIAGSFKLINALPDTLENTDVSEIWVTGAANPGVEDHAVYSYYIAAGEVVGGNRETEGSVWNPLFEVKEWRYVDPLLLWGSIIAEVLLVVLFFFFAARGRKAV